MITDSILSYKTFYYIFTTYWLSASSRLTKGTAPCPSPLPIITEREREREREILI